MSRRVQAINGVVGVRLPDGWVLDAGDTVVVSDSTWSQITADDETLGRLLDLGATSDPVDKVPTFRDMQRAVSSGDLGLQGQIDAVSSELTTHEAATTDVHGIVDTAALETQTGAQVKADTAEAAANLHTDQHAALTANVHGIEDTSKLAWNEDVDVAAALSGQVLTKVGTVWEGADLPPLDLFEATYNFATPVTQWVITHNQNTYALTVETFDTNGESYEGGVNYPDPNTITVDFYYPTSGSARVWGQ